jgi:hypothetical protein
MVSARVKAALIVASLSCVSFAVGGCSRTMYTHRCVDGFVSESTDRNEALAGCGAHGGAISTSPVISRSRSSYSSSSRRYKSSGFTSSKRKKK